MKISSTNDFKSLIRKCHDFDIKKLDYDSKTLTFLMDAPWEEMINTEEFLIKLLIKVKETPSFILNGKQMELPFAQTLELDIQSYSDEGNNVYLIHCNQYKSSKFINTSFPHFRIVLESFKLLNPDDSPFPQDDFNSYYEKWWNEIHEMWRKKRFDDIQ